jgi:hypothetical protein
MAASAPGYLLPKELADAISNLSDQEFDRLLAAVLAEQKRRGKKPPVSRKTSRKPPIKEIGPSLTPERRNAEQAAFKAGVSPSVLPDSLEFPMRTFERRWQAVR